MAVEISGIVRGSAAEKAGLKAGMRLLTIDGNEICDGLDYEFYSSGARLLIAAENEKGKAQKYKVKKEEYEPLGAEFETYLIDKQHHCKNKCVFCFIDQLPKGLRKSLYFKDDDERLGFLFGNYITLTNLSQKEVERIIKMRISPVNISVHTANPLLRCEIMGNPNAGEALNIIPQLAKAGICMNFQLVLCPGVNDGQELLHSINWLSGFAPAAQSIAAVPVGLTKHRQGLAQLKEYTAESAASQLDIMLDEGEKLEKTRGTRLVYPSDEWFLLAGREIPDADFYEGYPQLENGVGMWRLLLDEFEEALDCRLENAYNCPLPQNVMADLATGALASPLINKLADMVRQKVPGAQITVHEIKNDFLGEGVTVAGLLTGRDITEQLKGRLKTTRLLLPAETLRAEGDIMLDGMSPQDIEKNLGVKTIMVQNSGDSLLNAILAEE